ncbi:MAG: N-acetylmuramoyl-L-alanine amidase [Hyphomonadaceae bacterium]|nr:N-acetylmuramoyl-L-alanine amidase [Hyphomonadaceae bacterium]
MMLNRRYFALGGASFLGAALASERAWADAPTAIRAVQVQANGRAVRLAIALDRPATAQSFFLQGPDRFVVDVAGARCALPGGASGEGAGAGVVRRYRYAQRAEGFSRLVFDLDAPAGLVRQEMGGRSRPELSFDLAATGAPTTMVAPPPQRLEVTPRSQTRRRTIVVDAGHGGRDPGAIGVNGTREKDVVLDAALKLRQALESTSRYQVALTRADDTFVPLEDRVRFARGQNADLFISLHADSSPNPGTTGASVYTLSENGAARAQNMMGAQNWDLDLGAAPRRGVIGDILVDLTQRETTNRSAQFAETVIPQLGRVSPLLSSTHRSAGFFVLLAPDVPAVLIETGFLSNATDERRLADPRQRERMAGAMADAVDAYFGNPRIYMASA